MCPYGVCCLILDEARTNSNLGIWLRKRATQGPVYLNECLSTCPLCACMGVRDGGQSAHKEDGCILGTMQNLRKHCVIIFENWSCYFLHSLWIMRPLSLRLSTWLFIKMAFKYIWTNRLSKNKKGCALYGDQNIKQREQKQKHNNHNFKWLYSMFTNHHISMYVWIVD